MSIFKIPYGLIDEIHSLLSRFWWGSREDARRLHWQSWEKLCVPKAKGGLGFRDLRCFNHALLAKQIWRLQNNTGTLLHSILKARYFKNSCVIDAYRGYDPSYSWRSMWGAKSLLRDGLAWRVGDGTNINVRDDPWIIKDGQVLSLTPIPTCDKEMRVCDLINHASGEWDLECIEALFPAKVRIIITAIPLSKRLPVDELFWRQAKDGVYTVKSGYWLAKSGDVVGNGVDGS
ncbi:uncharacterized mitochondrial protein AtMg00310-like [Spinacia oleracea]|uniref:Uncharacterized mitochondrial protein AtMg00310-like n=1 Tax=Spinacia oleracea TaxID=3562 RepID=A0A9R0HTZ3_SPIOL|nr:uncharacterized mitochondrial protein AtMg00310-like [Spinacia oleracea]